MVYNLPELPYEYDSLEPWMDEETVKIHHDKHHQAYTDKLNAALKDSAIEDVDILELLQNPHEIPGHIRTAVINNGGGYLNHNLFWEILCPTKQAQNKLQPTGELMQAIEYKFGSFESFKEKFSTAALNHFASGWTWLVLDNKRLEILTLPNQNTPLSEGKIPILTLDVWEHAYYIKYKNKRIDFISAFWNIVNWSKVEQLYEESVK